MSVGVASDVGDVGQSGEQSDEDEDERAVVVVSDSAWFAGIVGLFESEKKCVERCAVHENLVCVEFKRQKENAPNSICSKKQLVGKIPLCRYTERSGSRTRTAKCKIGKENRNLPSFPRRRESSGEGLSSRFPPARE